MGDVEDINQQIANLETQRAALLEQQRQAQLEAVKTKALERGRVEPKQVTYFEMTDSEFERLIAQEFGINAEPVAEEEWNNYSAYTTTTRMEWYDASDRKKVAEWLAGGKRWPGYGNLLCELVDRGRLPNGSYLIKVSW